MATVRIPCNLWQQDGGLRLSHARLVINREEVEQIGSFKYQGVHLSEDPAWKVNTKEVVKKAQQRLFFLLALRKTGLPQKFLTYSYQCTIERVLSYGRTLWFSSCTSEERKDLQQITKTAQKIIGSSSTPAWNMSTPHG